MNPNIKGKASLVNDVVGRGLVFGSPFGVVDQVHNKIGVQSNAFDGNDEDPSPYVTDQGKEVVDGGVRSSIRMDE
ncbi:hypothetical protein L6452_42268 [Arctium lappa]|uniref:Uncharacterized protein n=1 Tax=Arctium lappa TaxID=4217 RepID=A0ACB8XHS6_ARCLA|nr:hypothetical protein L6452_42268 [Arctium lappa]